jgi:hypothetical protein
MELKKIKQDRWYETNVGIGKCLRVGGTFPVSCRFQIVAPIHRGVVNVVPRDVIQEVPEPKNGNDPRSEKARPDR